MGWIWLDCVNRDCKKQGGKGRSCGDPGVVGAGGRGVRRLQREEVGAEGKGAV